MKIEIEVDILKSALSQNDIYKCHVQKLNWAQMSTAKDMRMFSLTMYFMVSTLFQFNKEFVRLFSF
jgi:hypothetical protein